MISDLTGTSFLEREEIGTNPIYETLRTNEELSDFIKENIEFLEHSFIRKDTLGRACGHLMVDLLVFENKIFKNDQDTLSEKSKLITGIVTEYAKNNGDDPRIFLNGFLAETAACLAFKELGFTVLSPTIEEDLRAKIDYFVYDPNSMDKPFIMAVQVKNSSEVEELYTHRLDKDPTPLRDYLYIQQIKNLDEFATKLAYSTNRMVEYVSKSKSLHEGDIFPVLIIVPGGEYSENCSYNMLTGTPRKDWKYELLDSLEKNIYSEEDK